MGELSWAEARGGGDVFWFFLPTIPYHYYNE